MSEIILQDWYKNIIATDGKNVYFAHSGDSGSGTALFIFLHLLLFPIVYYPIFDFLIKKYGGFLGKYQFMAIFGITLIVTLASFVLMNKKFNTSKVNVPIENRKDVFIVDLASKNVTEKSKGEIIGTYPLSEDAYFVSKWFRSKNSDSFTLRFLRKNEWTPVLSTVNSPDLEKVITKLEQLGIPVQKDHSHISY